MIPDLLKNRNSTHGDFDKMSDTSQRMKDLFKDTPNWLLLDYTKKESLEYIANKIARVLNGNPDYDDHWVDIIGYATLILNEVRNEGSQASKGNN